MYPWYPWSRYGMYGYGIWNVPWFPFFSGRERGIGHWFWIIPWIYSALWRRYQGMGYPLAPLMTPEQEKQMLEDEMRVLQQRMEDITKRLEELC